jgi:outer membrane protein OmpA-like peptidoglycan-associated protein
MHARFASGIFLALGFADLAVLDLILAPRLAAEQAAHAARSQAIAAVTPPKAREEAAPRPAAKAEPAPPPAAQTAAPPPAGSAAPVPEAPPAVPDVLFGIESKYVTSFSTILLLKRLAEELKTHPGRRLLLRGHADRLGSPAHNLTLSRHRAEAVRYILITRGAPGDRISVEAVGDAEPADREATPAAWARNRRVQILWR